MAAKSWAAADFPNGLPEMRAKTKDPSRGTTGRAEPYGRLGGWALAPNTASTGRDKSRGSVNVKMVRYKEMLRYGMMTHAGVALEPL
jgi:hypothetical protein